MEHERRRDRVWKFILNRLRVHGEVSLDEISVPLETKVSNFADAKELVNKEDHRSIEDVREDPGGDEYIVQLEPDASSSTKRDLLLTISGDRYQLAVEDESRTATWVIGPHLEYMFGTRSETPIDDPLKTEFEVAPEDIDDFDMTSERRRDRLWFQALNMIAEDRAVTTPELDTSLTLVPTDNSRSTAMEIVDRESYRQEIDITERDGKYIVKAEPDVSHSTKLSLVKTLAKQRYDLLKDNGTYDGWVPGPWGRAIFDLPVEGENLSSPDTARQLTDKILDDDDLDMDDQVDAVKGILSTDG